MLHVIDASYLNFIVDFSLIIHSSQNHVHIIEAEDERKSSFYIFVGSESKESLNERHLVHVYIEMIHTYMPSQLKKFQVCKVGGCPNDRPILFLGLATLFFFDQKRLQLNTKCLDQPRLNLKLVSIPKKTKGL